MSLAWAKTQAVPVRPSLQGKRASVVVPAAERARLISEHEKRAPSLASRTSPEKSERSFQPPPPPPVSHERHEKPVTQAQLNSAHQPPPAHVERQPNMQHVQPRPQGPPPAAHANPPGKEKEKEHGKED